VEEEVEWGTVGLVVEVEVQVWLVDMLRGPEALLVLRSLYRTLLPVEAVHRSCCKTEQP